MANDRIVAYQAYLDITGKASTPELEQAFTAGWEGRFRRADGLIGIRRTAELLGVHENTVRNWVKTRKLRVASVTTGGFRKFSIAEVEELRREMMRV